MKTAVVGDIGVDYYTNLDLLKPGGIAFNFAYNFKQTGKNKVSLVGILGNEKCSKKLLELIKNLNINSNYIQKTIGNPPRQNIILKNGERKFIGYNPGVLSKWNLKRKDLLFLKSQDAIFIPLNDGMEHIFNAVKKIKGPIKVVDFSQDYEFADFDKKENVITKNAKYFDIIFIGGNKNHKKMVQSLANNYPEKVFVLTLGAQGSMAFNKGKKYIQRTKKIKLVDTTGAGDAFEAGFLSHWILTQGNLKKSLKKGTLTATSLLGHIGSTPFTIKT